MIIDDTLLPLEWFQSWLCSKQADMIVGTTGHTGLCCVATALHTRYPGRRFLVYGRACDDATNIPYKGHRFAPWLAAFDAKLEDNGFSHGKATSAQEALDVLSCILGEMLATSVAPA